MIHQPVSVVSQCLLNAWLLCWLAEIGANLQEAMNAWLLGWLAEIGADLQEAIAHYRCFMMMLYTNSCTVFLLFFISHLSLSPRMVQ